MADQTITRKKEELAFAEKVNAEVIFLDLPDTNCRGASWWNFDYTLNKKDNDLIARLLINKITSIAKAYNLFCPLGVGMHPDHIACYYSSLQIFSHLRQPPESVFFYEEIPYSLLSKSRLLSQEAFLRKGELFEFLIQTDEKIRLLECYTSQLQPEHINQIASGHSKERMIKYNHSIISKSTCITAEYLALMDGIKLV
jgi:LmbE family N-acetylglucosaminyl deacetylase